jgi:hypothetical protein
MADYLEDGAALRPRLAAGEPVLADFFRARTARWKYWHYDIECAGIDLFCDLHGLIAKPRATALLVDALDVALAQRDPDLLATALWLVITLADIAHQSSAPPAWQPRLEALAGRVRPHLKHPDVDFLSSKLKERLRLKKWP